MEEASGSCKENLPTSQNRSCSLRKNGRKFLQADVMDQSTLIVNILLPLLLHKGVSPDAAGRGTLTAHVVFSHYPQINRPNILSFLFYCAFIYILDSLLKSDYLFGSFIKKNPILKSLQPFSSTACGVAIRNV